MKIRKAVVPAAGRGTRLYPATRSQPKEMLPLGRKPTIQLVLEELVACGLDRILIVTGQQKRAIEDHFDRANGIVTDTESVFKSPVLDNNDWSLFYTRQSDPKGLGDAIRHAEGFVDGEQFIVALGDAVIDSSDTEPPLARLMRTHCEHGAQATILLRTVEEDMVSRYGIVEPANDAGEFVEIASIVEKPTPQQAPSRLAVSGRYAFDAVLFDYLGRTGPGIGGEMQLTDAIQMMLQDGLSVCGVRLREGERRHDIGNFQDYVRAFLAISLEDPEIGPTLRRHIETILRPL